MNIHLLKIFQHLNRSYQPFYLLVCYYATFLGVHMDPMISLSFYLKTQIYNNYSIKIPIYEDFTYSIFSNHPWLQ